MNCDIKHILLCTVALYLSGFAYAESTVTKDSVRICSEDTGWPPFSTHNAGSGDEFTGFNKDIMTRIFAKHGIKYEIVVKPWKRCLLDAMHGDIDIVLDAAKNPEREKNYLFTEAIYTLRPVFFYAKKLQEKYPEPVAAEELKSLLMVCGQKGYTYNNFGFDNSHVAMVSKDVPKVLSLALVGRCDVGLARKEVLLAELKKFPQADQIAYQYIKDTTEEPFYWLINRNTPNAMGLKNLIDTEVKALYQSGVADMLLAEYY